ncbi:hypothetical protein TomTYG75_07170 [Sphingobium sp. TomTYG75]
MKLGPWLPDQPNYGHDGLVHARNVFATPLGYEPVKAYSAITTALASTYQGGRAFIGIDGTVALLAGTAAGLYRWTGTAWDLEHSDTFTNPWQFAQFGDKVIGVQGAEPVEYDIAAGTAGLLGGTPPNGKFITTVKDFVVISGVDSANSTVYWSAINNSESWTPGTDQSDFQVIPDGGEVTGLAGGEYLLIFQRDQIWRGQYVGVPFIFQFDKISQGVGCIAPKSIVQVGRTVYFVSQRGFMAFTDGDIKMIGANKVDTTFFAQYSVADIESSVSVAVDPIRKLVIWAMPRRLWCYNWELDRWTDIEGSFFAVSTGAAASYTLDDIDALYPGGIETVPGSFDDPIWQGGDPFLLIAADDGTLGSFGASTTLEALISPALMDIGKGRDIRIRSVRLDTDAVSGVRLEIEARKRLGDSSTVYLSNSIRANGDMPIRASGRYVQPRLIFQEDAEWSFINGFDFVQAAAGGRQ